MQAALQEKLSSMPAGTVFFVDDLAEDASESLGMIRRFLLRSAGEGTLLRIARGIYCKPRRTQAGVALPPDQDCVIRAIARHHGIDAVPMGLSAAWKLGLIGDRPNPFQLASSRGQYKVSFNGWALEFLPGRSMPFTYRTELAALLLTGLSAIGEENLTPEHAAKLKRLIVHCPDREAFREDVAQLPVWMKNYLRRL